MWIETLALENLKCFEKQTIRFGSTKEAYPWITLLGENGTGKSTVLQALAIMLAGQEGANQLIKPEGWLKDNKKRGVLNICLHQGDSDPGLFGGKKKERKKFSYTLYVTSIDPITINNRTYTEPVFIENTSNTNSLSWLRQNALLPKGKGWFGAGYGAFRRLTRNNRIIVPSLQTPSRLTNFLSQFQENEPLEAFETWMVYLDYRTSKSKDPIAAKQKEWSIKAINHLLPEVNSFYSIDADGRIWFNVNGEKVSTVALSDGFRSVLALSGDLVWRLINSFPESKDPLQEQGVVLIDELDIHLHQTWQRTIAGLLRQTFTNIQFIMATHSPLVAAGSVEDAITYRFYHKGESTVVEQIEDLHSMNVDKILQSPAFGLVSTYSPEMQEKIEKYYRLKRKTKLTPNEKQELQGVLPFVEEALGYSAQESETEKSLNEFIKKNWK